MVWVAGRCVARGQLTRTIGQTGAWVGCGVRTGRGVQVAMR